ncbi:hypothetical protein ONZ51_g1349 [Trametes cubensis]|uniref:Uncharacterized protein n=1 Tax=Trametes cubensis TaxID=1111947 RepID=A0AAD7U477_9APHY|nr:hypothetical protein ONZ51_g1349 [Trametes cubensis]
MIVPSGPTLLGEKSQYRLSKNDLLLNYTGHIVSVVPAKLDVERLREAIARTFTWFPLFCGRLVREPEWAISVSPPQPVPLVIKPWNPTPSESMEATLVVRVPPALPIEDINPFRLLSGEEPVLGKFTILTSETATAIAMSCTHIVSDLYVAVKFMRVWSQQYVGDVIDRPPVYEGIIDPELPADPARLAFVRSKLPKLLSDTFPFDKIDFSIFAPFPVTRVDVFLSGAQVRALHSAVLRLATAAAARSGKEPNVQPSALTRQDVLSALIVAATNASYDTPVTQIHSVMDCRGVNPAFLPREAIANGIQYATTAPVTISPDPRELVLSYATHIRASLIEARDPQYVKDLLAVSGEEWYGPAQANLGHYVAPSPGQICINSSYRVNWSATHFGYPGQARWHHPDTVPTDNYVLMFPSNPVYDRASGTWRTDEGACDVSVKVRTGRQDLFAAEVLRVWKAVVGDGDGDWQALPKVVNFGHKEAGISWHAKL